MMKRHCEILLSSLLCIFLGPAVTTAATRSTDVTVMQDGTSFDDHDVVEDDGAGTSTPADLGLLPNASEIIAYHRRVTGEHLFVLGTTTEVPGPITAGPRDILEFDGSTYSIAFNDMSSSAFGGIRIDGISLDEAGNLELSFDSAISVAGVFVDDEDIIVWKDPSTVSVVFDGSARGVPPSLDVDAFESLGGGYFAVSFDTSGSIDGLSFDDEDILIANPGGTAWQMLSDGDMAHSSLAGADVDALFLPEPTIGTLLGAGTLCLALLRAGATRGGRKRHPFRSR